VNCVTREILIYLSLHKVITVLFNLHIDLDSNKKRSLHHMRISNNNRNKRANADSKRMLWMQMPKSYNRIMRMQIMLITASTSAFSLVIVGLL